MNKQSTLNNREFVRQYIFKRNIKDFVFISIGVILASIGLKGFLFPSNFLDGGAMGVSLLLRILTGFNLSALIVLINLPFILLGAKQISISFAVKSTLAIIALASLVHFIHLPV
ncbi:MAG: YitT family protein, partial [Lutibacter sp.]|nr:YitT family protein [Lutibacter sp.]